MHRAKASRETGYERHYGDMHAAMRGQGITSTSGARRQRARRGGGRTPRQRASWSHVLRAADAPWEPGSSLAPRAGAGCHR